MAAELLVMSITPSLKVNSPAAAALLDSVLLAALLSTVGYLLVAKKLAFLTKEREFLKTLGYRNSLVIESIGEAIFATDINGNIVSVNRAAEKTLDFDKMTLIGKHSHELFHYARPYGAVSYSKDSKIYATLLDGKVLLISDEVFWKKDGTAVPVAYIASPFIENGKITGVVVSFHQIIERKKQQVFTNCPAVSSPVSPTTSKS